MRCGVLLALLLGACGSDEDTPQSTFAPFMTPIDFDSLEVHGSPVDVPSLCGSPSGAFPSIEQVSGTYVLDLGQLEADYQEHLRREVEPWTKRRDPSEVDATRRLQDDQHAWLQEALGHSTVMLSADQTFSFAADFAWGLGGSRGMWTLDGRRIVTKPPLRTSGWGLDVDVRLCHEDGRLRVCRLTVIVGGRRDPPLFTPRHLTLCRTE